MPDKMFLHRPLRGIIPPIVTPLLSDRKLDKESLERLIDHVVAGGVHGLFVLGTSGEGPALSGGLRREVISIACRKIHDRIPVLVGITDTSPDESILLAQAAQEAGAAGLVAAPPPYFHLTQDELIRYFSHVADNVSLPLYLYNIPSLTKIVIESSSVKILARHPRIVGLKDSSGDGTYFNTVLSLMKDDESFSLFIGPDEMMAGMVLIGAHGGVNAGANLFPKLYVDLYNASVTGNIAEVKSLQQKVMEISIHIYNAVPTTTGYLKGIKSVLAIMGICSDFMEFPLVPFELKEREIIQANLFRLNIDFQKR